MVRARPGFSLMLSTVLLFQSQELALSIPLRGMHPLARMLSRSPERTPQRRRPFVLTMSASRIARHRDDPTMGAGYGID
jgi:hypothetical protein